MNTINKIFSIVSFFVVSSAAYSMEIIKEDDTLEQMGDAFLVGAFGSLGSIAMWLVALFVVIFAIKILLINPLSDKIDAVTGVPGKVLAAITSPISTFVKLTGKSVWNLSLKSLFKDKKEVASEEAVSEEINEVVEASLNDSVNTKAKEKKENWFTKKLKNIRKRKETKSNNGVAIVDDINSNTIPVNNTPWYKRKLWVRNKKNKSK